MIAIINTGGDPLGECTYNLMINRKVIAEFTHNRPDGLAVCLQKAAMAAEKAKWHNATKAVDMFLKENTKP